MKHRLINFQHLSAIIDQYFQYRKVINNLSGYYELPINLTQNSICFDISIYVCEGMDLYNYQCKKNIHIAHCYLLVDIMLVSCIDEQKVWPLGAPFQRDVEVKRHCYLSE